MLAEYNGMEATMGYGSMTADQLISLLNAK
jgi:hypothetical protein